MILTYYNVKPSGQTLGWKRRKCMSTGYRDAVLQHLFNRAHKFPIYRHFMGSLSRQDLDDLVSDSLKLMLAPIERFMVQNLINPALVVDRAPMDMERYYQVVFRRRCIKLSKDRHRIVLTGELEILDAVRLNDETIAESAKDFSMYIRATNPGLAESLESEMAFYLYVLNEHLTGKAKKVADAFIFRDPDTIEETRREYGEDNCHQIKRRLFVLGGFHRIALHVGQSLILTGAYSALGCTRNDMKEILEKLQEQYDAIKKRIREKRR